jgi:Ca2+-binding RTX toxin-like protein
VEFIVINGQEFVLADGTIGGNNNGVISGSDNGEFIDGRGGGDILYGNGGDDTILGGDGDDNIHDGTGLDTMTGGTGRDTFHLVRDASVDKITDLIAGEDTIIFDRTSFGLAPGAEIEDLIHFGPGFGPNDPSGPGFYVANNGTIYFTSAGSFAAGEVVAQVSGNLAGLSADDFGLT